MKNLLRHPEKFKNPSISQPKRPDWLKVRAPTSKEFLNLKKMLSKKKLVTVCEEAACPNISECWTKKHATMMILGEICTRACAFCNIRTGIPNKVDENEPKRVAEAVLEMGLDHVVITSVDRDDLPDGGATQFAKTINNIRKISPGTTIEILTPDFLRAPNGLSIIIDSKPDVFNHNIETIPGLYGQVRPGSRYFTSLKLLHDYKNSSPSSFSKSGIMVGMGETKDEVLQVMDDLRAANVDFLTIGQYLQPTPKHFPVKEFISPSLFKTYYNYAISKGFLIVSSSPLTRSSYHAGEDFLKLKEKRNSFKK